MACLSILSNMAVFNSYYDIETVDVARGPQGASGGYGASLGKITFTTKAPSFAEQVWPVLDGKKVFANVNYNYTSSYLTDPSLSRYSKVDAYGLTDLGVGFGAQNRSFEVSLLVKNLFNVDYGYQPVWNLYIPSAGRWAGVTISSKFY